MSPGWLAIFVLLPVALGPLPQDEGQRTLVARLCAGGEITIPLGDKDPALPESCPFKACHAGGCRKKFDLAQ